MYTFVVGNGPSAGKWLGVKLIPSIGCNIAIKDFDLTHLVCVDRLAMVEIRKLKPKLNTTYWCKKTVLEVPPGWNEFEIPGIDSGSAALHLAAELYPENEIIAIGFDGVLGLDNCNRYQYHFRPKPTPDAIRQRHLQTVLDILPNIPRVQFVSYQKHELLETIAYDQALKIAITQSRKLY